MFGKQEIDFDGTNDLEIEESAKEQEHELTD
jgi:hypothetical protein